MPRGGRRFALFTTLSLTAIGCYPPPAQPTFTQSAPVVPARPAIAGSSSPAPVGTPGQASGGGFFPVPGSMSAAGPSAAPIAGGVPVAPVPQAGGAPVAPLPQAGGAAPGVQGPAAGAAAPNPACMFPACISDLIARCPPMGECSMTPFGSGPMTTCFANGVKLKTNIMFGVDLSIMGQTLNPDGSMCYAFDGMSAGEGINLTWHDSAGNVAATGTANMATMALTVTCTGAAPVTLNPASCGGMGMMMSAMMPGMMGPPMCTGTAPCM